MTEAQVALVLSAIAIAVAVLTSLWSAGWAIWFYRRTHRPKLRVTASPALAGTHDDTVVELLSVVIANNGPVPLTLTNLAFRILGDSQDRQLLPREWLHSSFLPKRLDVGELIQAPYVERQSLRSTLVKDLAQSQDDARWTIIAVANDATGAKYESKAVTI